MARGLKFPIRYKILAVLSLVVMAAVAVYLYLASKLFYEDKTELVYELNQNNVRTMASDLRADILRTLDKLNVIGALLSAGGEGEKAIDAAFAGEEELVKVAVLEEANAGAKPQPVFSKTFPAYLGAYGKDPAYLDRVRSEIPIPFDRLRGTNSLWVRNSTLAGENTPPLMTVALAVGSEGSTRRVLYADVRLDRILEAFPQRGIAQLIAVDSDGHVLAHSDQTRVVGSPMVESTPLLAMARSSQVRSEVHRFEFGGSSYLGSFFQTGLASVLVLSAVETGEAFAAAERLIRKSVIFAAVVVTAAFLVALFFSHSLTAPISRMLEATQWIARGDFTRFIHVTSHDELATLAASFNSMTADLKSSREQIEEYSRDLEKKVQDRTARLEAQNVAIKEAQEALVRTTRLASVGEVAGRAAHEVLNPLTNVTARLEKMQTTLAKGDREDLGLLAEIVGAWNKELAEKGPAALIDSLSAPSKVHPDKALLHEDVTNLKAIADDLAKRIGERKSDLEFLLREAGRISKIVNGMRQLTRVSGNRRPVEIHRLLDETIATMADVLRKNKIATETRYCAGNPTVLADRDELIQVFSNLMRNSMQAIRESISAGARAAEVPHKIWFATETVKHGDRRLVYIRACDNGPGIAAENMQRVFEPSFTTKSVEDGTGLGLSIARRFIRAYEGEIIVEKSVPGVETTFLIELPENGVDGPASAK
jgi:signal transduction histidine kinase